MLLNDWNYIKEKKRTHLGTGTLGAMIDHLALGVLTAALGAGALASEAGRAAEMGRTVEVAFALVTAAFEGTTAVAGQTGARSNAVNHLALGVGAAGVRVLAGRL